ncbi:hypothetical protein E2C01_005490 [Portunus trituberculatus]|uniref:Uncharacterized protein n=1 Tax=Portunus trituberculatus TaxID=210409 RepID=A0A5B7CSW3_PORTR|nr:hypothetical protein [Portunus trituberculatus]
MNAGVGREWRGEERDGELVVGGGRSHASHPTPCDCVRQAVTVFLRSITKTLSDTGGRLHRKPSPTRWTEKITGDTSRTP